MTPEEIRSSIASAIDSNSFKLFYVYLLKYPDGSPFYVGKGCDMRIFEHQNQSKSGMKSHKCNIIRMIWKKKGEVDYQIDRFFDDEGKALAREMYLIKLYGRRNNGTGILTNLDDGGVGVSGMVHSEEVRRRIRKAVSGENHYLWGKFHSKETKKKMSLAKKGKPGHPISDKVKEKIRNSLFGVAHSEEWKRKSGDGHRGMRHSEATKRKMSIARSGKNNCFYGKKHTEEHRGKISESCKGRPAWNKGIPQTEEVKRKLSESCKGRIPWNKGLGKETDERIMSYSRKLTGHPYWGKQVGKELT